MLMHGINSERPAATAPESRRLSSCPRERPILFSTGLTPALLSGRKTQTRRVAKMTPTLPHRVNLSHHDGTVALAFSDHEGISDGAKIESVWCPYGKIGDRLWVRETFLYRANKTAVVYRADLSAVDAAGIGAMYGGWKPSIHLPRKWSRITLEITEVRVQRLQEISEADAQWEGVGRVVLSEGPRLRGPGGIELRGHPMTGSYRDSFSKTWDGLNANRGFSWQNNPWVWALTFRRLA